METSKISYNFLFKTLHLARGNLNIPSFHWFPGWLASSCHIGKLLIFSSKRSTQLSLYSVLKKGLSGRLIVRLNVFGLKPSRT